MSDRPILFSAPMVRAILDGTKTQTRRVVKGADGIRYIGPCAGDRAPAHPDRRCIGTDVGSWHYHDNNGFNWGELWSQYGNVGDRLWVKETWAAPHEFDAARPSEIPGVIGDGPRLLHYAATAHLGGPRGLGGLMCRPSIFMPRWASRITLEVTSVRVERLHEITEFEAIAEGVEMAGERWRNYAPPERESSGLGSVVQTARDSFFSLWESINGTESLAANPWVWVVGFKRVQP